MEVLCGCSVLGDILFICVGFIRVWVGFEWLDGIRESGYGDSLFCCDFWSVSLGRG